MMIMAAVGYALVKFRVLKEEDSKVLTALLVYALQPCLIFRSLQIDLTPERASGFAAAIIFAFSCMFIAAIAANLLRKPFHLDPVDMCTLMFANVGNLVLPVIAMMLGDEMTFYCAGFQMPFNLFVWIYGYILMSGRKDIPIRKIVFNPNLITLFLGMIFLFAGIKVPAVIDTAMEGLQNMVAGASMMLVGIVIAGSNLREIFANKRSYLISAGRLIFIPILTILLLYATGFLARYPQYRPVLMVVMLAAAAPAASSVIQLSVLTGRDAAKAGTYNVMSTLLCVVTMPLIIYIYQLFFPM
jgi:predicted permease